MNPIEDSLANHRLTAKTFSDFYRKIKGLRFPIEVADVMELRDTINHAADGYTPPPSSPDYRQFLGAIQSAIESFGIESKRHSDHLKKVFTMLRELHYQHSIRSRNKEFELRQLQDDNRLAYSKSMRYAIVAVIGGVAGSIVWLSLAQAGWIIKSSTILLSYLALDYFHSLTTLDRELKIITYELNALLRDRVEALNWKILIHKLSLILGFKNIEGVDVFLMHNSADFGYSRNLYH